MAKKKIFKLVLVTTFRKHVEVEAETEEEAIEQLENDVDEFNSSTDTLDFETTVELDD